MSTTPDTTPVTTTYVRFISSGLTWAGAVRRHGHVLAVTSEEDPDGVLSMSEKDQRNTWGRAFYETLTAEEYAEAAGAPSITPEAARPPKTPPPPGAGPEITRGGEAMPALATPGHVPPAAHPDGAEAAPPLADPPLADPPPPPAQTSDRWPWYATANVAETLAQVADMSEAEAMDFLTWEQSHKARTSVLGPMKGN